MAVLLGLPWLASVLLGGLGGVASFLATYIGKRIAIIIVVIAACLVLVGIFITAISAVLDSFLSHGIGGTGFHLFIPNGLHTILSLWLTAKIAFWLYSWNVKIATLKIL